MYFVIIKPKHGLNAMTQYVGPFGTYAAAEAALCNMPAAIHCDCKWIERTQPAFDQEGWDAALEFIAAEG